jgi:hypothetical protein
MSTINTSVPALSTPGSVGFTTSVPKALILLSRSDQIVFESYLNGDDASRKLVKALNINSTLHSTCIEVKSDTVAICDLIKLLNDPETYSITSVKLPASGVAPSLTPALALLVNRVANKDPLIQDQNVRHELSQKIDIWENLYGLLRGDMLHKVIRTSIQSESSNSLTLLLDRGLLTANQYREVRSRDVEKKYAVDVHDVSKVFFADSILKSQSASLIKSIVIHPAGPGFLAQAKDESIYTAQDLLFDRREHETLDLFMTAGGRPNLRSKEYATRAWVIELINKMDDADMSVFERLVTVHGMRLDVFDEMRVTPFSRAVILGNLSLVKFLSAQKGVDFYATDTMNHTSLDYAYSGALRRAEKQATHMESYLFDTKCVLEEQEEWRETVAALLASGTDEDDLPGEPSLPALAAEPPDYPLELISVVEHIFSMSRPLLNAELVAATHIDELDPLLNLEPFN